MKYKTLGRTDLSVSALCLGSMTWGSQNTTDEGHSQIDRALDAGINFIDTAEMYPVNPISAETAGNSERVIGKWFAKSGRRADVILATKVSGAGNGAVRGGAPISAATIREAAEQSLQKLQTDYIDLYQLHWPNRGSYHFRQCWTFDPTQQDTAKTQDHICEVLQELGKLVNEGKVRHIGLSNESAWGTGEFLRLASENNLPRVATVQNEYSLMCRLYDTDMAEMSHHENVDLLSFSPLAAGLLTGKYQGDQTPPKSRRSHVANLGGRITPRTFGVVDAYLEVARKHGLEPVHMALAFCIQRPFMGSTIFGSTSLAQIDLALGSADVVLSQDVLDDITATHRAHPAPF
ncbi:MAG: aldo/keto reductase [Pikeienuella sp.]